MLSADLGTFLTDNGVTATIVADGQQELFNQLQDEAVLLNLYGGLGESMERTFDDVSVQIITRGGQNDPASAEVLAHQIDDVLMGVAAPVVITTRVIKIVRTGGPPRFLDYDKARRRLFVCSYMFTEARTTF